MRHPQGKPPRGLNEQEQLSRDALLERCTEKVLSASQSTSLDLGFQMLYIDYIDIQEIYIYTYMYINVYIYIYTANSWALPGAAILIWYIDYLPKTLVDRPK